MLSPLSTLLELLLPAVLLGDNNPVKDSNLSVAVDPLLENFLNHRLDHLRAPSLYHRLDHLLDNLRGPLFYHLLGHLPYHPTKFQWTYYFIEVLVPDLLPRHLLEDVVLHQMGVPDKVPEDSGRS
ncbi:uncharacterized protein LOC142767719 [Rhipicephalus microplus]|uniref:uncharacterized protein LOC142767719 n=1 Tax=Rhipicephalus microplus TaxID=6941 RepID=UPI003F6B4614